MVFAICIHGVLCSESVWIHVECGGLLGFLWMQSAHFGDDSGHFQLLVLLIQLVLCVSVILLTSFVSSISNSPPEDENIVDNCMFSSFFKCQQSGMSGFLIEYLLECCRGKGLFLLNEQEVLFGRSDVALIWGLSVTSTAMKETSVQVFPRKVFPKDKAHQLSIYRSGRILREVHRQDKSWRWGGLPV